MKSLLLGSAAGLLAAAGVQAADMPQPEPVEYVRICETYGVGFWYIPGTDTCLRIGGYVRMQLHVHGSNIGEDAWGGNPFVLADDQDLDGDGDDDFQNDTFNFYARGLVNFDARTETPYGTLRSFIQFRGTAVDVDNATLELDLGFLQFAGITAGLAPSFLDFATNGFFGDHVGDWNHDTPLLGYTYQFGGGVSFNVAIESADRADTSAAVFFDQDIDDAIAIYAGDNEFGTRTELPDLTAALRVKQAWGEAMLGGVLREVKGRVRDIDTFVIDPDPEVEGDEKFFDDVDEEDFRELGFAVVGGLQINLPMLAEGDTLILRAAYGEGASRYVVNALNLFNPLFPENFPFGFRTGRFNAAPEAVFTGDFDFDDDDDDFDFETAPVWSFYAGVTHYWTPTLRSNLVASLAGGDFNGASNGILIPKRDFAVADCLDGHRDRCEDLDGDDWSVFEVTANLIWSPVKNLDIGLELIYSTRDFDDGAAAVFGVNDADNDRKKNGIQGGDEDGFGAIFRIQRNFGS